MDFTPVTIPAPTRPRLDGQKSPCLHNRPGTAQGVKCSHSAVKVSLLHARCCGLCCDQGESEPSLTTAHQHSRGKTLPWRVGRESERGRLNNVSGAPNELKCRAGPWKWLCAPLCEALISWKQGRERRGRKAFIPVTNHLRFPNAVSQCQRQRLIN